MIRKALAAVALALFAQGAEAADSAVGIMYHRFGESALPSTNTTLEQFGAHLAELTSGRYTVVPIADVVAAVNEGKPLPDRAVFVTIDDAFASMYREAWPRLKEAGIPFTLFVATDSIDAGHPGYMTWDQLRELARAGVTIGSQTASHPHMAGAPLAKNRAELEKSNRRFAAELGARPTVIAYPYGEASREVMDLARETGFEAGFGQHSGVVGPGLERFYLPRFPLNEAYGGMDRFRTAINALPLGVANWTPADPLITEANDPTDIGFGISGPAMGLAGLACYASHTGRARVAELAQGQYEIPLDAPLPSGRSRINCTAPTGDGRWYWFGWQFVRP